MRSLSDYKDIYRQIASDLNLQGDSVELLIQFLANASYIEEVQNITYSQEAVLETATQMNSKIIHCLNQMYSVFRGSCPRVMFRFHPDKVQSFNIFDEIAVSNSFKVYYLGYYDDTNTTVTKGMESVATEEGFVYAPLSISVTDLMEDSKDYIIIGLLAKDVVNKSWTLTDDNPYYVNCNTYSGLSNDMYVKVVGEEGLASVTRHFSDHVEFNSIFDLTLPDFGSRLYFSGNDLVETSKRKSSDISANSSTSLKATYFKYSTLSEYNQSELKKINVKGVELIAFSSDKKGNLWLKNHGFESTDELATGVIYVDGAPKESLVAVHYKANKERYLGSIVRSNSDLGNLIKELYPEKVKNTHYEYDSETSTFTIYYVPQGQNRLTSDEIQKFIDNRKGYFVTNNIQVLEGDCVNAVFNIRLGLVDTSVSVENEVGKILEEYSGEFNTYLGSKLSLIKSTIGKISNVREVIDISINYLDAGGQDMDSSLLGNLQKTYFNISTIITSSGEM